MKEGVHLFLETSQDYFNLGWWRRFEWVGTHVETVPSQAAPCGGNQKVLLSFGGSRKVLYCLAVGAEMLHGSVVEEVWLLPMFLRCGFAINRLANDVP